MQAISDITVFMVTGGAKAHAAISFIASLPSVTVIA